MSCPVPWVLELSPTLFWDTDRTQIDDQQHLKIIIERVVERGTWPDWQNLRDHVTPDQFKAFLPRLRLRPRERSFLEAFLKDSHAS